MKAFLLTLLYGRRFTAMVVRLDQRTRRIAGIDGPKRGKTHNGLPGNLVTSHSITVRLEAKTAQPNFSNSKSWYQICLPCDAL